MAGSRMNNQHLASLKAAQERLETELRKTLSQVAALEGELRGIGRAMAILKGEQGAPEESKEEVLSPGHARPERRSRGAVKDAVLGIITSASEEGLKTSDIVELGKARGVDLDRNSVASLLSRLARDGVLAYDSETRRYKVAPPNGPTLRSVA